MTAGITRRTRRTRRQLGLITSGSAGTVLLAACAGSGAQATTSGTSQRAKGGSATFMATGDADRFQIRDRLMPRLAETTGVKGEWVHFSGAGYYDKLFAMMAADTVPDLFLFAPSYFAELVTTSRLRTLSPLIKRDRYDL